MASNGTEPRSGRETRILILVVGVAIALLLLLAQFRFPGADMSVVAPSSAPLAGLASRGTFEEMATTMADVLARVSPLVVVVPLEPAKPQPDTARRPPRNIVAAAAAEQVRPVLALAVRVRRDLAVAYVPSGLHPRASGDGAIDVAAHDASREIMVVRVPPSASEPDTFTASVRTFPGLSYVAAVDATSVGPTIQPVFIGRADSIVDPRWSHPLAPVSSSQGLVPGVLVFALNGRLAGMVVRTDAGPMVVPAPALETLVRALEAGSTAP